MLDTDFDDFLDSDDDALFVEASNNITDYVSASSESTDSLKKNILQNEPKSAFVNSSQRLEKTVSQDNKKNVTSYHSKLQYSSLIHNTSATLDHEKCLLISNENAVENKKDSTLSAKSSTSNTSTLNKNSVTVESPYINNRFIPGFTPKAKKRKLPGPAGLLELYDESEETEPGNSHKMQAMDIEFENIVSSQFTLEHLSLPSWQKLQTAVSSCPSLHSTAKHFSIKRVLKESSKKKLPKHMIVPILCVLLKKITYKGSTIISVFMDDTGEINGKIDAEVLSTYKEYIVEGTTFILKKVTFLCNMLLLKAENLVSMYHPDGAEKHLQTLESILETSEPLKPMKCECLKSTYHDMKNNINGIDKSLTVNSHKVGCISHNASKLSNISNHTRMVNMSNLNPKPNSTTGKSNTHVQSMRSDAFLEDLLDDGNGIDEFDELLGNLDEKSFMEDL